MKHLLDFKVNLENQKCVYFFFRPSFLLHDPNEKKQPHFHSVDLQEIQQHVADFPDKLNI